MRPPKRFHSRPEQKQTRVQKKFVFYAKQASLKMLAITINGAKNVISRNETVLRGEVGPKDAHCRLELYLVTAFVPKAAGESTLLAEAILPVSPVLR